MLIPFRICSCSQRLNSSSCPASRASSSLPSIPAHVGDQVLRRLKSAVYHRWTCSPSVLCKLPISSAIFCLWVLFLTPLKRILFSSSSSSSLASWSSCPSRFFVGSVSTRGASPPNSLASCRRFLAAWMNAASGISPRVIQK